MRHGAISAPYEPYREARKRSRHEHRWLARERGYTHIRLNLKVNPDITLQEVNGAVIMSVGFVS